MDEPPIAVLDACVLYPASLRDLLVELAASGSFRARWTAEIHDEWLRNLRADRPDLNPIKLDLVPRLMDRSVKDCLVVGHMALVPGLNLPDPDDRHVLAAAIHSGAGVIVTKNLKDFPPEILRGFKVEARHPDDFLMKLAEDRLEGIQAAARAIRRRLRNPPATVAQYLATLEQQGVAKLAARLRESGKPL